MNADPRYFENASLLNQISYREAIELAFYGASVIHPKTLQPLQKKEIPLYVKSFLNPLLKGTSVSKGVDLEPHLSCFIVKRNQPIFTEVSKALYDQYSQRDPKVSWNLYKPFSLKWMLTGNIKVVAEVNKNMIESTEVKEKAFGLKVYLKENYTQYYKSNP
jgi:aspartate kinase